MRTALEIAVGWQARVQRRLSALLVLLLLLGAPPLAAMQDSIPDPFAGVLQRRLGNGLTLWFKRMPGAGTVSVSLSVASGSDLDPRGREELAHVVEHALFSARDGETQEQITRAITDRGGTFNASTSPDRTLLWVNVAREHGPFALDWLYQRVAPREWDAAIMPDARDAVALELGLAPRTLLGFLRDEVLLPPRLMPPRFWQREFGMDPPEYRAGDRFAALERISIDDVATYYREHYVPSAMILLVTGDLYPADVLAQVEATFGTMPVWLGPQQRILHRLKQTPTRRFLWNLRDDVGLELSFRLDSLTADDYVNLVFVQQLLQRRLLRRLRWGEQQAVYGVHGVILPRAGTALLRFEAGIQPAAFDQAMSVFEDELARLRQGRYPPDEFEQDRAAVSQALRLNNGNPGALRTWHASTFYRPEVFDSMPALATRVAAITPDSLAAFVRARLGPRQQILSVSRPLPLGEGGAAVILLGAIALGVLLARKLLLRPVELHRLRYVARLHPPLPLRLLLYALFAALLVLALRLYVAALHRLADPYILARDSFILQAVFVLTGIALAMLLAALILAAVPRKVLVFEHELRIKFLSYRSRAIQPEDIAELRLASFGDVWLDGRILRTIPLALGWRKPALLLRTRHGADWFIAVRDTPGLAHALERLHAAPGSGGAGALLVPVIDLVDDPVD